MDKDTFGIDTQKQYDAFCERYFEEESAKLIKEYEGREKQLLRDFIYMRNKLAGR